jgi:hypothetical protein
MAEQLLTGAIQAPGFSGLNIQDSTVQLNSGFALEAYNCVIDRYGRIGARKGWNKVNTSVIGSGGSVRAITEFVTNDVANTIISAANNHIYAGDTTPIEQRIYGVNYHTGTYSQTGVTITVSITAHGYTVGQVVDFKATSGAADSAVLSVVSVTTDTFTLTSATSETATGNCTVVNVLPYAILDDNWQFVSMPYSGGLTGSPHLIAVQKNQPVLVYHKLGGASHAHTGVFGFQRLGDVAQLPTGYTTDTFKPDCALTAFGRLWVANIGTNDQVVYFSDLQDSANFKTGTAGYLDVSTVIPTGDGIVALASHNGFLVIFCHRHVILYANPTDPAQLTVQDVIKGVGCIARDSIASVAGTDNLFLTETGVQSLQRLVQEKSMPFRDVSKNVRDDLISNVNTEAPETIKAVYYPTDAMYLLTLPTTGFTYCFDTRGQLENGAARTTIWRDIEPTAFCVKQNRELLIGRPGYIGVYEDYMDDNAPYRMSYYTNYFDMDQPTVLKILKKVGVVAIGGRGQNLSVKWAFDYTGNYDSQTIALASGGIYEYGIGEYGIAEYSSGISLDSVKFNATGTGKVAQLGFECDINGSPLSIQKIDLALKQGKNL